ncbi:MAG: homoserine dehydrogenase [Xanthomonadaceae bacterium]|nr:homoserine dehydrogenase [Xanthomonadaceae bacterium]
MNLPAHPSGARVALIGTGQVAQALAQRIDRQRSRHGGGALALVQVFNSRGAERPPAHDWLTPVRRLATQPRHAASDRPPQIDDGIDLVIDLSASDAVAAEHADWLARGLRVVTANKRGLGEGAARADAIRAAAGDFQLYGDSATVGAGLGGVRRLRELSACGEQVYSIAGVLSGTLAWLFDRFDGSRPFSELVREAHAQGFTEPDPREDIAGADVVRKLRILARAVGWPVPDDAVEIDPRLHCAGSSDPWNDIAALDPGMAELLRTRPDPQARPAVVARAAPERLRVALEWLPATDPLAQRSGCDNAIVIHSERYRDRPLVLRGPGAGPELTAAAVLEDALNAVSQRSWRSVRAHASTRAA